jgi:hypothetical protein
MKLLEEYKTFDGTMYRKILFFEYTFPEQVGQKFIDARKYSLEKDFRTTEVGCYIKKNSKELEVGDWYNIVTRETDVYVVGYMREKDIAYMMLKFE